MGFFSNLLGIVRPLISTLPVVGPLASAVIGGVGALTGITTQGPAQIAAARTIAQPLPGVTQTIRARSVALATQNDPRLIQERQALGRGGGNGQFATDTIVETVDLRTGVIVRRRVLDGSPFLMNNEVRKLRQVARKLSKANAKLPRKTVRVSAQKELIDAITQTALRRVLTGPGPHGHIVSST